MAGTIAGELLDAFFADYFFILLYILVIIFIRAQYQKYLELQSESYGKPWKGLKEITEQIILTGLVAGFSASFATVAAGIVIDAGTVRFLFYIMCLLLFFDLRFVSISYAAGVLAAAGLVFGIREINIPSLVCLAAILQMTEGILLFLGRRDGFVPVFIRHKGEIAGAYLIRKFWMVPVVFFTYAVQRGVPVHGFAPARQILSGDSAPEAAALAFGLDCLVAVLCHTDVAITMHPERKSGRSAAMLFSCGAVLLALGVLSAKSWWAALAGVTISLAGQEGIYLYSRLSETGGKPLYGAAKRGLKVLDVLPGSHARMMGLERGDVILSVNNNDIQTEEGLNEALREFPTFTWIHVLGWDGRERTIEYRCYPGGYNTLGIITVPREKEVTYNIGCIEHMSILRNIVNKFRRADRTV